jgi:hypothetical protein
MATQVQSEPCFLPFQSFLAPIQDAGYLELYPEVFPRAEIPNVILNAWYYIVEETEDSEKDSKKTGFAAKCISKSDSSATFNYMMGFDRAVTNTKFPPLISLDFQAKNALFLASYSHPETPKTSVEDFLSAAQAIMLNYREVQNYDNNRIDLLKAACKKAAAIAFHNIESYSVPDTLKKICEAGVKESLPDFLSQLKEGQSKDGVFGKKQKNAQIIQNAILELIGSVQPGKARSTSANKDKHVTPGENLDLVEMHGAKLEQIQIHLVKLEEMIRLSGIKPPMVAPNTPTPHSPSTKVKLTSMIADGSCGYHLMGVSSALLEGKDLREILNQKPASLVADAKIRIAENIINIQDLLNSKAEQWSGALETMATQDKQSEWSYDSQTFSALTSFSSSQLINRMQEGKEWADALYISFHAYDTALQPVIINANALHPNSTEAATQGAIHATGLAGFPEGMKKNKQIFFILKDRHYYLAHVNDGMTLQSIFDIGASADDALNEIINFLKTTGKLPLEALSKEERTKALKRLFTQDNTKKVSFADALKGNQSPSHNKAPIAQKNRPVSQQIDLTKKTIPCRFFHSPFGNKCVKGRNCEFSHSPTTNKKSTSTSMGNLLSCYVW